MSLITLILLQIFYFRITLFLYSLYFCLEMFLKYFVRILSHYFLLHVILINFVLVVILVFAIIAVNILTFIIQVCDHGTIIACVRTSLHTTYPHSSHFLFSFEYKNRLISIDNTN